jgi:hypothetical protein
MDFPIIVENINNKLFSIEARKISVDEHGSRAAVLTERLTEMQRKLKHARCYHEPHSTSIDNHRQIKKIRKGI